MHWIPLRVERMSKDDDTANNGGSIVVRLNGRAVWTLIGILAGASGTFAITDGWLTRPPPRVVHELQRPEEMGARIMDGLETYRYPAAWYWRKDDSPSLPGLEAHLGLRNGTLDGYGWVRDMVWHEWNRRHEAARNAPKPEPGPRPDKDHRKTAR